MQAKHRKCITDGAKVPRFDVAFVGKTLARDHDETDYKYFVLASTWPDPSSDSDTDFIRDDEVFEKNICVYREYDGGKHFGMRGNGRCQAFHCQLERCISHSEYAWQW